MKIKEIDLFTSRQITASTLPDDQFIKRWSPRALSGGAISEVDMRTIIEAARWAPSCFNAQPWASRTFSLAAPHSTISAT